MKINRTFSIDYDLAQKLRNKPNQSRIVCKAVRRFLANSEQYTYSDLPTVRLLSEVRLREDCPKSIKVLIQDYLHSFE
jgi:hypothetical protein